MNSHKSLNWSKCCEVGEGDIDDEACSPNPGLESKVWRDATARPNAYTTINRDPCCLFICMLCIWGFPKIRGAFLGVPMTRTIGYLGLDWGPYLGKLPYLQTPKPCRRQTNSKTTPKFHASEMWRNGNSTPSQLTPPAMLIKRPFCFFLAELYT